MRDIVKANTPAPFTTLTPVQIEICRQLQRLDAMASCMEAEWGVGVIEDLLSKKLPDLADKWESQKKKLNKAIEENDEFTVPEIVDGCIRAYNIFDQKLRSLGSEPRTPAHWEVKVDGVTYLVTNNLIDAKCLHRPLVYDRPVVILTLEELINVYHMNTSFLHGDNPPERDISSAVAQIDWSGGGDSIPW